MKHLKELLCNYAAGALFCLAFLLEIPNYPFTFILEKFYTRRFFKKCKKDYEEDCKKKVKGTYEKTVQRHEVGSRFPYLRKLHVALVPIYRRGVNLYLDLSGAFYGKDVVEFSDDKYVKITYYNDTRTLLVFMDDDLAQFEPKLWEKAFTNYIVDLATELLNDGRLRSEDFRKTFQTERLIIVSISDTEKELNFHHDVHREEKWETVDIMMDIHNMWGWANYGTPLIKYIENHVVIKGFSALFWYFLIIHRLDQNTEYGGLGIIALLIFIFLPFPIWQMINKLMEGVQPNDTINV